MLKPDITLTKRSHHHVVGREFMGGARGCNRWFCESHDAEGYWLYPTDGSCEWINVSEAAIGRSFHEIYELTPGLLMAAAPGWKVKPYGTAPRHPEAKVIG